MAVHVTVDEAISRAEAQLGKIGLPQPCAPWGTSKKDGSDPTPNWCCFGFTWLLKDNGGRSRSDYRNGSIRALREDRKWKTVTRASGAALTAAQVKQGGIRRGDGLLLRWEATGLPDHIGIVTDVAPDGSWVDTIEANSGPAVGHLTPTGWHRRRRYPANIVGAIRPPYLTQKEN